MLPLGMTLALTGDSTITTKISVLKDQRFVSLMRILQQADVAYTQLETLIHDYEGPELYPAAEAAGTAVRSPRFVADEYKWAGFDMVSLASNHALDYSYGGLFETWKALGGAGLVHAGTGRDLAEARSPAYLDSEKGRIALISMTSTFPGWGTAADARRDLKGRPGVNPLRYHYAVDSDTLRMIISLAKRLGWWVTRIDAQTWVLNPPGMHNTLYKFVESDGAVAGVRTVVDADDQRDNLRVVRDAKAQADLVIVHVHNHEWDPDKDLTVPTHFLPPFARACIDAGADVFVAQGSHAPLRGIEIYKEKPVFYDPGDFFRLILISKFPTEYYAKFQSQLTVSPWEALPSEGVAAKNMSAFAAPVNPRGGYWSGPIRGGIVPLCKFTDEFALEEILIYPFTRLEAPPSKAGLPILAEENEAKDILAHLRRLSAPYATEIEEHESIGLIRVVDRKPVDNARPRVQLPNASDPEERN